MITLLIGGARAGKSARALSLAETSGAAGPWLFVATAQGFDDEMRTRIDAHRRERGSKWKTLETPLDVAREIERSFACAAIPYGCVVIDCLTLWVSNILLSLADPAEAEVTVARRTNELVESLLAAAGAGTTVIVVTNEVGLGVVPDTLLGRVYRDALGRANQLVAETADTVTLMVAGLEYRLKG